MRIFHTTLPEGAAREGRESPLAPGITSVQFGREKLLLSPEPAEERAAGRGARVPSREEAVSKDELHVVVQNGRLFQQHHPDVPVIHDRGRFLLVKLDPDAARAMRGKEETCYGVMPLVDDQVVFDERTPTAARESVAFIKELVDRAKRESLEATLEELVAIPTRHSTGQGFAKAATRVRAQLKELGYETRVQTITVNGKGSRNVIADKAGEGPGTREVVIVTAHLDSINIAGGSSAPAPGADDNGSGSAALMEIARVFEKHRGVHDLRLILFGGEEQGLFGSKKYVASLTTAQRNKIKAVVNMDMVGSLNGPAMSVLIEGAPLSQAVIDKLAEAAHTYTGLTVETSLNPFSSDHVPFINAKVPAVLTIEGADNANGNIHSASDTIDRIHYDLTLEIVRMNVAFVAGELGQMA